MIYERKIDCGRHIALRQLQEKYRERRSNLHPVFIDLEKAYNLVPREELYWCMREKLVPEKYIRMVKDTYAQSETVVQCAAGTTEAFPVKKELHQGSVFSPFLFAIIMECLTEEIRERTPWQMMFADYVVLCANSPEEFKPDLEKWRTALEMTRPKYPGRKLSTCACMVRKPRRSTCRVTWSQRWKSASTLEVC